MTITNNWFLNIDIDDILRGQGADPHTIRTRKPSLVAAAQRARSERLALVHPAISTREVAVRESGQAQIVLEDGAILAGKGVVRHLAGAQRLVAAACTIGKELEETVASLLDADPLYALALDGLGNAAVERLAQQVCQHISQRAQAEGLSASTPFSPGSPDWPLEIGQPQLLEMVAAGEIGIQVTPGGMMIPKKSITFITGLGTQMKQTDPCKVCNLQETCHYHLA